MLFEYALSAQQEDFYDVTSQVREAVTKSGIMSGVAVVFCPHTTAGMTMVSHAFQKSGNTTRSPLYR